MPKGRIIMMNISHTLPIAHNGFAYLQVFIRFAQVKSAVVTADLEAHSSKKTHIFFIYDCENRAN